MYRNIVIIAILLTLSCQSCFASPQELKQAWSCYKTTFLTTDGRIVDFQRNKTTTSEGQAYAMLRAIIMNDKTTFDKVFSWSENNLKRKNDNLYGWLWGFDVKSNTYGQLDDNSASDADTDTAYALILAANKWHNSFYLNKAKLIINDIWNNETVNIKGERVLTAGYVQAKQENIDINPSYFAPYAFRKFAIIDKSHNWTSLVNSSYSLLEKVSTTSKLNLPPDWFAINKETGKICFDESNSKSNFSYDAIRTFFRIYLDYKLYKDSRAEHFLEKSEFFTYQWKSEHKFYMNYKQTGQLQDYNEPILGIATILPAMTLNNKKIANEIYKTRIASNYDKQGFWQNKNEYYSQNLVWFGVWAYENEWKYEK